MIYQPSQGAGLGSGSQTKGSLAHTLEPRSSECGRARSESTHPSQLFHNPHEHMALAVVKKCWTEALRSA